MGLKPDEVRRLTLGEFNAMYTGYKRRQEEQWDMTRHIMSTVINGYFGIKKTYTPEQVLKLEKDKRNGTIIPKIRSDYEAYQLLREFEQWQG